MFYQSEGFISLIFERLTYRYGSCAHPLPEGRVRSLGLILEFCSSCSETSSGPGVSPIVFPGICSACLNILAPQSTVNR